MADLETALNDLLADPNAMGQLLSLAGQLGLDSVLSPPEQPQETPPEEPVPPSTPPPIPPEQLGQLGQFLSLFRQGSDPQAEALLAAPLSAPGTPGKARPGQKAGWSVPGGPAGLPPVEGGRSPFITPTSPGTVPTKRSRRTVLRDLMVSTLLCWAATAWEGCCISWAWIIGTAAICCCCSSSSCCGGRAIPLTWSCCWGWLCCYCETATPELSWRTVPSGREKTVPASRGAANWPWTISYTLRLSS